MTGRIKFALFLGGSVSLFPLSDSYVSTVRKTAKDAPCYHLEAPLSDVRTLSHGFWFLLFP